MITLLLPAAGIGKRIGGKVPKQFISLRAKPLFIHTLLAFENHPLINSIIITTREEYIPFVKRCLKENGIKKVLSVAKGGETRQESVYNALKHAPASTELFLVHDAVRPFVSKQLISRVIEKAKKYGSAIPAIPVRDTLIQAERGKVCKKLEREGAFLVQTPQGFRAEVLRECLEKAKKEGLLFTDEGTLLLHYKKEVYLVEGDPLNFKITYPQDLLLAERLIECKIEDLLKEKTQWK